VVIKIHIDFIKNLERKQSLIDKLKELVNKFQFHGENVGGRHVGIGKGVYVSYNGGETWENKGLKKS